MGLTKNQAIEIEEKYKEQYPLLKNKIKKVQFNPQFNVVGDKAWIIIGEFEEFEEINVFFISFQIRREK